MFYHGILLDACVGLETEEVCHVVDCWKYFVSLQVCLREVCDADAVVLRRYRDLLRMLSI